MRHKAKQPEMRWDSPEGFSLEVTEAVDGFKVAAERERSAQAAAEVAKLQGDMFPDAEGGKPKQWAIAYGKSWLVPCGVCKVSAWLPAKTVSYVCSACAEARINNSTPRGAA